MYLVAKLWECVDTMKTEYLLNPSFGGKEFQVHVKMWRYNGHL